MTMEMNNISTREQIQHQKLLLLKDLNKQERRLRNDTAKIKNNLNIIHKAASSTVSVVTNIISSVNRFGFIASLIGRLLFHKKK